MLRNLILSLLFALPVLALYGPNDQVLMLTNKNFQNEVFGSGEVVAVEFFAPWCGHCQRLVPEWKKAAASLKGLVKVAGIDCDQDSNKPICGSQGIQGFPTIKIFAPTTDSKDPLGFKKRTVDYQGPRTAKSIADFVIGQLPASFVTRIASGKTSLSEWLDQHTQIPHVLLVSAKKDVPPLFKALSTQFRKRAVFAEAKSTDEDVIAKYGLTNFPAVVVIKDGEFTVYDGVMKHEGLHGFISKFAPPPIKAEKKTEKSKKEETIPFDPKIVQVSSQTELDEALKKPGVAVVTFMTLEPEFEESVKAFNESIAILETVKKHYHEKNGPFGSFIWVNTIEHGSKLMRDFDVPDMLPSMLILNDKKKVYMINRDAFEKDAIISFLKDVWEGRGRFFKYDFVPTLDKPKKDEL